MTIREPATEVPPVPGAAAPSPGITSPRPAPRRHRWYRATSLWLFLGAFAAYLVAAWWLNVHVGMLFTDSMSRVSSVAEVLLGRDPHLAAIGFIFTPVTALAQLPLASLGEVWPGLLRWNLTAATMTAVFMAGAVVQIHGIGRDRGLPRTATWLLTALFAANPMIVLYAANGMSEAPFLFFVLWAVRRLIRWMHTDDVSDLVAAGVAIGLAYLTRYESLAVLVVAAAGVGATTWLRAPRAGLAGRQRGWSAATDAAVVALPGLLAFAGWTLASWLITGSGFAQFTSRYGNAAIVEQTGAGTDGADGVAGRVVFSLTELAVLAPAGIVLLVLACVLAWWRREPGLWVPVLLLGSVFGVQAVLYALGATLPFLRFYIAVIPLAVVLVMYLAPAGPPAPTRRPGAAAPPWPAGSGPVPAGRLTVPAGRLTDGAVVLLALGVCLTGGGVAVTTLALGSSRLAVLEHAVASAVVPGRDDPAEQAILRTLSPERRIAEHLDALDLPEGSVLLDTVQSYGVFVASGDKKQFVTPSNRDFVRILDDPAGHGVRYILTVPNTGRGESDSINRRHPTLYANGDDGLGRLVLQVVNDSGDHTPAAWRLYEVTGAPGGR